MVTYHAKVVCILILMARAADAAAPPVTLWTDIWDGPGGHDDFAEHVAFDGDDVLYVAGSTLDVDPDGTSIDNFLRRYDERGVVAWTLVRGGPGHDVPTDMLVASDGGVVLVGTTNVDIGHFVDVVKVDGAGQVLWSRSLGPRTHGPLDHFLPCVAEGPAGELVVAFSSNDDYRVDRLDASGNTLWSRTWDSGFGGPDLVNDVAVDGAGNVYVTGRAAHPSEFRQVTVTIAFDPIGTLLWDQTDTGEFESFFNFGAVGVTDDGGVVVVANPESTCGVFQARVWRLDGATGERAWIDAFPDDPCATTEPVGLDVAPDGSVVVGGFGSDTGASMRMQAIRYDATGARMWAREFDETSTGLHRALAVAFDGRRNVVLVGEGAVVPQTREHVAVAFGAGGDLLWNVHWAAGSIANGSARAVAVSPGGRVAMAGSSFSPATRQDATVHVTGPATGTGVPIDGSGSAIEFGCAPSVFTELTRIRFALPTEAAARLDVFDLRGRRVRTLFDGRAKGLVFSWDGRDAGGRSLASGVYLLRLESVAGVATTRVGLIR